MMVQRYDCRKLVPHYATEKTMVASEAGKYICYSDHAAEVKRLKEVIKALITCTSKSQVRRIAVQSGFSMETAPTG